MLNKAVRELDKEQQKLVVQEKKIVGDIRKSAQEGKIVRYQVSDIPHLIDSIGQGACKVMAKDLISNPPLQSAVPKYTDQFARRIPQYPVHALSAGTGGKYEGCHDCKSSMLALFLDQLTPQSGNAWHEQNAQYSQNAEHYERL